jgi:hypothetical protein
MEQPARCDGYAYGSAGPSYYPRSINCLLFGFLLFFNDRRLTGRFNGEHRCV